MSLKLHTKYLDAESEDHWEGRYINDGPRSNKKVNAKIEAAIMMNVCKRTGKRWVRVIAKSTIKAGDEILLDYGKHYNWTKWS